MAKYPDTSDLHHLLQQFDLYAQLQSEYGARGIGRVVAGLQRQLKASTRELQRLAADPAMAAREPNELGAIRALRPGGSRRLWPGFDRQAYAERLQGALLARSAGCTLGAPVEGWPIERSPTLAFIPVYANYPETVMS